MRCGLAATSLRTLGTALNHGLTLTRKTVRVLQNVSRLCRRALDLSLRWTLSLLLDGMLVRLGSLSLKDRGLLGWLRPDGLIWELSSNLR